MTIIAIALISYLLGSIPSALIVVKLLAGLDVRSGGSGNMGAMNTVRMLKEFKGSTYAAIGFLIVWIFDMLKAILAVWIAQNLLSDFTTSISIATLFVILGHNYPIFLRFKGGRGAASFMGIILYYNFKAFILWVLTIFLSMLIFEIMLKLWQRSKITKKIIFEAISQQIIGRLIGELIAVYVIYVIEPKLILPTLLGTILIVISHYKRLLDQLRKLKHKKG